MDFVSGYSGGEGSRENDIEPTRGTRFSKGKPGGWWYAPLYGLRLVADVWTAGAAKYSPMDWREGQMFSTLFDSMSRHWLDVQSNGVWSKDSDTGAYSLACMAWNVLCLLTFMALGRHDLDDITPWQGLNTEEKERCARVAESTGTPLIEVLREFNAARRAVKDDE